MDNFAMLWNIDKIFGMLEDLMAINKAARHFVIFAKIGQIHTLKDSLSNTENYSEMRTCSSGHTQSHITPLKCFKWKILGDVV